MDFDSGLLYGLSYTYLPKRIGAYASFMSTNYNDNCFVVGPALRLSDWPADIDFQLYGGAGLNFVSGMGKQMVYDLGLRMNFDDDNSWSRSSISAGCAMIYDAFYPYLGLSVGYPWRLVGSTSNDYCSFFCDYYFGIGLEDDDVAMGIHTAWVPSHLGAYASLFYSYNGVFDCGAGLVWRLSDSIGLDFQLYGGLFIDSGFDFGMRMGFGDGGFSCIDFLLGATIGDVSYFNIGISVAILALAYSY